MWRYMGLLGVLALVGCTSSAGGNFRGMDIEGKSHFPMTVLESMEYVGGKEEAVVQAGKHHVAIKEDKVILNYIEQAKIPPGTKKLEVERTSDAIQIKGDGKSLMQHKD